MTRETLEAQLRRLPAEDRAHLARVLLESLDDEPAPHPEWLEEGASPVITSRLLRSRLPHASRCQEPHAGLHCEHS